MVIAQSLQTPVLINTFYPRPQAQTNYWLIAMMAEYTEAEKENKLNISGKVGNARFQS